VAELPPVPATEDRIAAHGIAQGGTRDRSNEDGSATCWQQTWRPELGQRFHVRRVLVSLRAF
jgi:hypothetical protein